MTNEGVQAEWDESGKCHECGHWRADYCNADGFHYCGEHYPEGLRWTAVEGGELGPAVLRETIERMRPFAELGSRAFMQDWEPRLHRAECRLMELHSAILFACADLGWAHDGTDESIKRQVEELARRAKCDRTTLQPYNLTGTSDESHP